MDREVISQKLDGDRFALPKSFGREEEVRWMKVRADAARVSSYQDRHCGQFPFTFDPSGGYRCSTCNKLEGDYCLLRADKIAKPEQSSCKYWEAKRAGDMEIKYCPHGLLNDELIAFGTTPNEAGFGCVRCEYGQKSLATPDSEGRSRWCELKGMPVEANACCAENDPVKPSESSQAPLTAIIVEIKHALLARKKG